ncbi:MAG: cytochrome c biogenesis protein CcdA [Actinomycetia bacterium]|nr:cytochrome c biogenesis protein CcdA [Actinomycetes bacterium]
MTGASLSVLSVLWAGILSFASPCFLPVVPVFVGYLTGQTAATGQTPRRWFAVGQALAFMAAFTAVFVAVWCLIGLVGWFVGGYRSWLRIAGGIILVILGLHTAGFIQIGFLDRVLRVWYSPDPSQAPSLRRSVLLGLTFAAGWSPCIGSTLGAVLGLAAVRGSVAQGALLLLVYSVGLGIPFVLVCAGVSSVAGRLSWFVKHQRGVNIVIGLLLILVGFVLIANLSERVAAWAALIMGQR